MIDITAKSYKIKIADGSIKTVYNGSVVQVRVQRTTVYADKCIDLIVGYVHSVKRHDYGDCLILYQCMQFDGYDRLWKEEKEILQYNIINIRTLLK